ncbi:MAU2 chromatid cohesion factor homolog isoform X1 [Dendroctonus ponderosae]|uniref:MAU2 chromatid cohesion factor homolog n=1 Tax=Dendroctonus ponderosae TaxID=77166 RepID=A0AAR5P524_DENPD|nr:MAU2 chromatid cohesion factor homolog isoform X1 [Dendroctonus ponderosae]KAH1006436.1 hypothetical protein HUJ05_007172 [Dendroctonus ponderosae]
MASSQDAWYLSLLGLAEYFRASSPPQIKLCIQCLQAVFNFKPPQRVEARTHLQLGNILLSHTKNIDLAKNHLEQAWMLSQPISTFDDVKFEAASILAELEQQNQISAAKPILRKAIELSQHNVYWHCRLIFQLAQIHAIEKDYALASSLLGVGVDYAHISNAHYTRILFLLSKGMLLLIDKKLPEVHTVISQAGHLIETWTGGAYQREYVKVCFLVLQVCHYLMGGQIKAVKPCLKQLQQSIQVLVQVDDVITGPSQGDMFLWLPKEHLYILVYLLTVMHSMQAGYMEKAQKYTDKACVYIEKLKSKPRQSPEKNSSNVDFAVLDNKPILSVFQLMLLEHIIMCNLVMGNKTQALQEISSATALCKKSPRLLEAHGAQLHTLLGLYSMSMDCLPAAEAQFLAALNTSQERELWTFANLNLAIVYLRGKRDNDFNSLFDRINPENLPSQTHSLKAAAYYVHGLQAFFQARYNEAKRYLRETLKMANAEDLNRLTSGSLVLLGHIFLSLGNSRESMNMVTPAMQLASKIPDVHVQLWASAVLKDLHRICGDTARENEAYQRHVSYSQTLRNDQHNASKLPQHCLIYWTKGDIPI